jgi:hypothetical protein
MRFNPNKPILQLILRKFLKVSPSHIGVVASGLLLMGYLYFGGLVRSLWHSGIFVIFVVKSVTLAFEGLGAKGARMDLMIGATSVRGLVILGLRC